MKLYEVATLHATPENWARVPVYVWEDGDELVTEIDGQTYRAGNMFALDSRLSEAGVPMPRNLYFVDEPAWEDDRSQPSGSSTEGEK